MSTAGIKVFSGMSVKDHPTIIDDKHSPDLSNVRIDDKIGSLTNMEGTEKYNTSAFDSSITAMFQLKRTELFGAVLGNYPTLRAGLGTPTGTPITNVTELQAMENDLAGSYYLANDIDASATTGWNGGLGFDPIGDLSTKFSGIFDGNGYTISDLFMDRNGNRDALFRYADSAEIKNLGLIDVDITGGGSVGSLIGSPGGTTVTNCFVTGSVVANGDDAGGLFGEGGVIATNVYSICSVSASQWAGGLVWLSGGTYNDCFWDTQISGVATSGGGTGKTTAQMKQEATFTNWDFDDIWEIVPIRDMISKENKSMFCLSGSKLYLI